jgi:hypothetical protein
MLHDISTPKAVSLAHIPHDIDHAIIFSPLTVHDIVRKALARFDSFPFSTPPSEESYADNVKTISKNSFFPLSNPELFKYCKNYISNGKFYTPKTGGNKKKDGETASKFQNPKSPK